jgi:thiol-disulfide isomerase/thioredoxin
LTGTGAPQLVGDSWLGTGGKRLGIEDFRGRFLLLDFWTLCCVNCHHVLAELRPIEAKFADALTVVGVHSPKFEHEKLPESVASAIERHDIEHPVLNDPEMATWASYGVRAWPTLVLVDPLGEIIASYSGEGHGHAIDALLTELVPQYENRGELRRGPGRYVAQPPTRAVLRQPGKVTAVPPEFRQYLKGADLLVSNSGGHDLVAFSSRNVEEPLLRIGSGNRGSADGDFASAEFAEPYGARFLPAELAQRVGYQLVVADTANHLIRGVDLVGGRVISIAGTGEQWMREQPTSGPAREVAISTPWDVELFEGQLLIGMAGEHRIWFYDFESDELGIYAGTTNEGLVDGSVKDAWFAQPSALVSSQNQPGTLWLIDAETSALRFIRDGQVHSVVGHGLFDFGHVDGPAHQALLQHPLGLLELPDGNLLIADAYNRSVRKYSPGTNMMATVARNLGEPSDIAVIDGESGAKLVVVEQAQNRITLLPLEAEALVSGKAMRTARPALEVAPGELELEVIFVPPPGQKLDERYGPSTHLVVSSTPRELLIEGAGSGTQLSRRLVLAAGSTEGVLHVAAKGASCDDGSEFASCHIHQQDWGIPIRVVTGASNQLQLSLSGVVE